MFRLIAFLISIGIVAIGITLIALNMLDIAEGIRLGLPIALLNTIFISAAGLIIASAAAASIAEAGYPEMLGLGSGALVFGLGILVYGWLASADMNARIMVHDGMFFLGAIMHITGMFILRSNDSYYKLKLSQKQVIFAVFYLVIIGAGAVATWLLYSHSFPSFIVPRNILRVTGAVLLLAVAIGCNRSFLKYGRVFYFWYALGLILIAFGEIFISQGALESMVAWLGRLSQYVGSGFLLAAVITARRRLSVRTSYKPGD